MSKKYVNVLKDSSVTPGYRIIAPEDYVYTENGTKKVKKIDSKADKKVPATAGNLATLDSTGNLADSGKKTTDFMAALPTAYSASGSATKTVTKVAQATTGEVSVTYSDIQTASTSQKGLVQLEDSTSSTSTSKAATPSSVKAAYDLANGKYSKPSGGIPASDLDSSVQASLGKADSAIQGVTLNGTALTPSSAKVVDLGNLKTTQTAVTDPTASGTTITAIATISQDTNGVITATKKTIRSASSEQSGVMSAADYTKLAGIATGAEVNQNAFSNVKVGDVTVAADSKTDTLTVVAGSNVTITPDATNDKITIAATDTTYTADDGIKLDGTVFKHTNSVSGGTVGPTTDTAGASFSIPYVTYDSQGHVTASGTRTHDVGTSSTSGAGIVQLQDTIDSTTTKAATPNAVKKAIEALDVGSVGGAGKYISAISESDGKISATATTMDSTPTASSTNAVTSGGVKTELDKKADADSVIAIADATVTKSSSSEWFKVAEYTYGNTSGFVWNGTWMVTLNGTYSARTPFSGLTFFIRFGARFQSSSSAPTDMSFTSSVVDESLKTYVNNIKFKLVFDVSGSSTVARLYYSPRMTYCMLALREVMGAIGNTTNKKSRWTYYSYSSSSTAESTEPVGGSGNLNMSWVYSASPDSVDLKADKVTGATSGHLASLDATGNLLDSGKSVSDLTNVQADWDETDSAVDSFIRNKPFYEKYSSTPGIKYKVCTIDVLTTGSALGVGFEFMSRYGSGAVHGHLMYKVKFTLYLERVGDVTDGNKVTFYYITNPNDSTKIDIYADSSAYVRFFAAPIANIPKLMVDFTGFGTTVESIPEGATAITPKWIANTGSSSGTAPVKINEYGSLSAVPMDSTPTKNSTNLMTSGDIYHAINPITPFDGYLELSFGSTVTFEDFCAGVTNTNSFAYKAFGASLDTTEKTIDAIFRLNLASNSAIKTGIGNIADSYPLAHVVAIRQMGYVEFISIGTGNSEQNRPIRFRFNRYGVLTICREIVTKDSSSATGSTSVPVYANDKGVLTACTDDFVHDSDVTSTYSSTGTAPVNGTAVAEAIASTDFSHISQNKLWHSLTVANTGSSQGWFKFATINKKSISYESYRIVGYLYYDEAGNFNSGALKRIPFQAIVNYTSDVYRLLIGKSTTGTRLRLVKISDTKYELQFYAYTNKSIGIHATHDKTNTATNDVVFETTLVAGSEAASVVTVEEDLELGSFAYRSVGDKDGNDITTTYVKTSDMKQDGVSGATVNRFGTCSTAAGTAAKTVTITSGTFSLEAGAQVAVKFSNTNTANSPTLAVNSTAAKNIFVNGAQITSGSNKGILAGTVLFIYDGTQYHVVGNYDSNDTAFAKQFSLGTTQNENVYTMFARMSISNAQGNGEAQFIIASPGNIGSANMGTWLVTVSNRGSSADTPKATMTVRCLNKNSGSVVTFGYYYDTANSYIYFGVFSPIYRGNNTITVLSNSGATLQDFGDSTTAPTGWTAVTVTEYSDTTHTHGNIANGGTLTDTAAAASGNDYVVIRDADNAKIKTSTIKGTDVADAVSKKHSHSTLTLSTTAQAYDGSHTLALPSTDPYTSARTPTSHASSATTYGVGNSANYGHVKLDNSTPLTVGTTSTDGVATGKAHIHNAIESVARASVTTADLAHSGTNTRAHMILSQITPQTSATHDPGDGYMLTFMWDGSSAYDSQLYVPNGVAAAVDYGRLKIRYRDNASAWGDWGYLPAASQATTLTSSDNLNSFKGTVLGSSVSYCWTSGNSPTGATEITGEGTAPTAVMQVIRTHSTYCIQVAYTASKGIFWRWANGDTWSSWTKILTGADITGSITSSDIDDIWSSV